MPVDGRCQPGLGRIGREDAVSANLRVVPSSPGQDVLADDCDRILAIATLLGEDEPFNELMVRRGMIEARAIAQWAKHRYDTDN